MTLKNNIDDKINIISTSFDFGTMLYSLYKDIYKCSSIKFKIWYEFKEHRWHEIDGGYTLYKKISVELLEEFNKSIDLILNKTESREEQIKILKESETIKKKLKSTSFKKSILEECMHIFYDKDFNKNLDENKDLLCFNNGVYDLKKMKFRKGKPNDYISLCTNIDYKPYDEKDENIKNLNNYFEKVFIDEDIREYMKLLLSSFIQGHTPDEKFHIFTGSGANSKSKLIELFSLSLGDYAGILPVSLLTQKRGACGSASPEMARAKGKRFITFSEAEEGDQIRVGLMKELTGGDIITARALFKDPIEYKPQFKLILTCNKLPYIPSTDGGTWRRLRVVPFNSKFTFKPDLTKKNEFMIDTNLNKHFEIWKESLISLLIFKFNDYKKNGIREPVEVLKYTNKYRADTDLNLQFIQDNLIKTNDKNDIIKFNELYAIYKTWYKDSGLSGKPENKNKLKEYFINNYEENIKSNNLYNYKFIDDDTNEYIKNLE